VLEFTPGKLTVVVGPNNAGKTQILRDIVRCLTQPASGPPPVVLEYALPRWPDSLDGLKELVKDALKEQPDGNTFIKILGPTLVQAQGDINLGLSANWEPAAARHLERARAGEVNDLPSWFGGHVVSFLRTDDRLQLVAKSTTAYGRHDRPNLLVALYYERAAEARLNEFFMKAFGMRRPARWRRADGAPSANRSPRRRHAELRGNGAGTARGHKASRPHR
jgi:hypothetical protein